MLTYLVSRINVKIFSLTFAYYQQKIWNGQTTHHTEQHFLSLSNSQAPSPHLSILLVILNQFSLRTFLIHHLGHLGLSGITSFLQLISNFLTYQLLLSEEIFPGNLFVIFRKSCRI